MLGRKLRSFGADHSRFTMKNPAYQVTKEQARNLALHCQGLARAHPFGKGKRAMVNAIEHLGYVQIDTISVVERAHHHVLWSRVPGYGPAHLDEAMNQSDGIFEYWSHAAAYLPMKDYRFSLIRKERLLKEGSLWFIADKKLVQYVYDRIKGEGPLCARNFEEKMEPGQKGWWNWKPTKIALEQLFLQGTLMVKARKGFQKVYDLTERVLPQGIDLKTPTMEEYATHLVESALNANGLASLEEICYQRPRMKKTVAPVLEQMIEEGRISRCRIDEAEAIDSFAFCENLHAPGKESHSRGIMKSEEIRILNPFDNAVIQRKRLKNLFDFEYVFECYVPAAKRKFGYFSLPLLWKNAFVGVLDCKADRKTRVLQVKAFHPVNARHNTNIRERLKSSLALFAEFNECELVQWNND